jgi:hypothetical protein
MLPVILLNSGFATYSLVASIVVILLFNFDPAFKFYKSNIQHFTRYMKISFVSGMLLATVAFIYPSFSGWVIAIWGLPTFIYGFKLSGQVDKLAKK